ncbi:hypothetical protein MON38_12275 [Hymenobacter sp. DH14]|uniref:Outer membrane protein beta-barrel domain-containing protein n=1 Tax=Hymenobacter cyanobacteriorum TaxID=2926463 RepID=A0A9X2AFU4_9BACT|nr:hypothetical protein [Hymenobacter cyanobacteriorum]MCI1188197.1 hypothetical protein [Hymenobacter cyanobacteriorum]
MRTRFCSIPAHLGRFVLLGAALAAGPARAQVAPPDTAVKATGTPARPYAGNGSRLFVGPTARNLRRGEGTVQDIAVFALAADYGISDRVSVGVLGTFVPGLGKYNLVGITPKFSVPVGERVHVGAGAFGLYVNGTAVGLTYANATLGTADHQLTAGVGFGFSGSGGFGSTPVLMLGGATRLGRRLFLVDETYLLHTSSGRRISALAGVAGGRAVWPRLSASLGLAYLAYDYREQSGSSAISNRNGAVGPYADVTFRFGQAK